MSVASPSNDTSSVPTNNNESLTIIDNRTGQKYEIPIIHGNFIDATRLKQLKSFEEDTKGIICYDPSFMNTAVAKSKITYIDGQEGILRYRGYKIEELAEKSTFLEVAYLLIYGELPTPTQYDEWNSKVMSHTYIHENLTQLLKNFRYDAHPMGMLVSAMAALSTFYEEANPALQGPQLYQNDRLRNKQIFRILGKLPTIAACAYRHRIGRPYNQPVNHMSYTENFLYMMDRLSEANYRPHPALAKALDKLFILHADHEMNNSTACMRHVSSTLVDPYTAVAAAAGALYGPLHGGANEQVLEMLQDIGDVANIPQYLEDVKNKKRKLMGFGHRVYKSFDPRMVMIKKVAEEVFDICGKDPKITKLWNIAVELEKQALASDYFVSRKLFPNIDFYSGLIYKAMGFPTDMFPVLFSIPRAAGWLAHWLEGLEDPNNKIFRPLQLYCGPEERAYVPIEQRGKEGEEGHLKSYLSDFSTRRQLSLSFYGNSALDSTPLTVNTAKKDANAFYRM